jgi:hypothetical protein
MANKVPYSVTRLPDRTWSYNAEFPDGTGVEGSAPYKWPAILTAQDAIRARGFEPGERIVNQGDVSAVRETGESDA